MPRRNPLDEKESAIGLRVAEARKELLIPRTSCALKCGISTDKLISYETGRAKLPFGVGVNLYRLFKMSPFWLVTGKGSKWTSWVVDLTSDEMISPRTPFSEVVLDFIKKQPDLVQDIIASDVEMKVDAPLNKILISPEQSNAASYFLVTYLWYWLSKLSPKQTNEFLARLAKAGKSIYDEMRAEHRKSTR